MLFYEGDAPDALYIVERGRVALVNTSVDGRESVLALMESTVADYEIGGVPAASSLGVTVLSAPDLTDESKFSWAVGAGLRWLPARRSTKQNITAIFARAMPRTIREPSGRG